MPPGQGWALSIPVRGNNTIHAFQTDGYTISVSMEQVSTIPQYNVLDIKTLGIVEEPVLFELSASAPGKGGYNETSVAFQANAITDYSNNGLQSVIIVDIIANVRSFDESGASHPHFDVSCFHMGDDYKTSEIYRNIHDVYSQRRRFNLRVALTGTLVLKPEIKPTIDCKLEWIDKSGVGPDAAYFTVNISQFVLYGDLTAWVDPVDPPGSTLSSLLGDSWDSSLIQGLASLDLTAASPSCSESTSRGSSPPSSPQPVAYEN